MKIALGDLRGPHSVIETSGIPVTITEAFSGLGIQNKYGDTLGICMRDDGFEVIYTTMEIGQETKQTVVEFKRSGISRKETL